MILISHRGNINGKFELYENEPNYIKKAYDNGYDVEIDVWYINNIFYLGHDKPLYKIDLEFLKNNHFWIHCKNIECLYELSKYKDIHYFWHQNDDYTLTSWNILWTYPGKKLTNRSVAVLPENVDYADYELKNCYGICSDNIKNYKLWI